MTVCEHCHTYKTHGAKCWYYWEKKKACSQFKQHPEEEPRYQHSDLLQITSS